MPQLIRTTSDNPGFQMLVKLLDQELALRDGNEHAFYSQFNKTDGLKNVVVYEVDGIFVGCGAFKVYNETTVEIKRMFVLAPIRGNRIAEYILHELEQWAFETGYTSTILETGVKQPEAIRLYKRCGYVIIANYGQYDGVKNSVCMRRDLQLFNRG